MRGVCDVKKYFNFHLLTYTAVTLHDLQYVQEAHFLGNACREGNRAVWEMYRVFERLHKYYFSRLHARGIVPTLKLM